MVRIAVVEDEEQFIEQMQQFLTRYQEEKKESLEISIFRDGDGILQNYHSQYDIIFMDIQMKFVDGMTAAEEIRQMDEQVAILFITNLPQYAIRGYEVGAMDYVLKPLSYFAFSQKLERAIGRIRKKAERYVTINVKGGIQRVELSDIIYIESQGHNLVYHTLQGELVGPGSMKEAEIVFTALHFSRGNKGYLINLEHVAGISDKCVMVKDEKLPLSRNRYDSFMKDMTAYWSEVR